MCLSVCIRLVGISQNLKTKHEPELMFKEDFHANLDPNLPKAIFWKNTNAKIVMAEHFSHIKQFPGATAEGLGGVPRF